MKELHTSGPGVSGPLASDLRRFDATPHQCYGGIDLHARTMSLCVLNQEGEVLLHRHMQAAPEPLRKALAPYREDLGVCVAWMFTWDLAR